ncbi:magnesium transporter [Colwellia demingiae]|uniref:Magnesium transporter n=1 Tax=Colwellia demingiae TaxID=89401 RepID=A0A5C6QAC7_9GAMM|nr:magnesium transporter [Colwellia demingiae]
MAKVVIFLVVAVVAAKTFAILGAIHGKDLPESYFSGGYPTILALLDSEVFMGLIFFITLSVFAYVGYLLWELHEVAVHKAEASSSPQMQLIFALSLCGLFIHKAWWVLAIIIAFTSWEAIGNSISNMIHKGITKEQKDKEKENKAAGENA